MINLFDIIKFQCPDTELCRISIILIAVHIIEIFISVTANGMLENLARFFIPFKTS